MPLLTISSRPLDEAAMTTLAGGMARAVQTPATIFLRGALGAGKTTFTRALVQALGHTGRVKSPSYGLLEHYELGSINVLHLDLYRITDPGELEFLGIEDLFETNTLLVVEWPQHGGTALPAADIEISFSAGPGEKWDSRCLTFHAYSDSGVDLCRFIDTLL